MDVTWLECTAFPGGWSYSPQLMFEALRATEQRGETLEILELGAGQGTEVLANLLNILEIPFRYISYEDNPEYVCKRQDVRGIHWTLFPSKLASGPYDLILMDGPRGAATGTRLRWFPLLPEVVRSGTILVVDDFYANPGYGVGLKRYFEYDVVAEKPRVRVGVDNWCVVRITGIRPQV